MIVLALALISQIEIGAAAGSGVIMVVAPPRLQWRVDAGVELVDELRWGVHVRGSGNFDCCGSVIWAADVVAGQSVALMDSVDVYALAGPSLGASLTPAADATVIPYALFPTIGVSTRAGIAWEIAKPVTVFFEVQGDGQLVVLRNFIIATAGCVVGVRFSLGASPGEPPPYSAATAPAGTSTSSSLPSFFSVR